MKPIKPSDKTMYDIIIIGGGPAGLVAAKMAKGLGKTVAIIEKEAQLGGGCTWTGCVPSKSLVHVANLARARKHLLPFLNSSDSETINTASVMDYVHTKMQLVYQTHTPEVIEKEGIDVIFGAPSFVDRYTVKVGDSNYSAKKYIIATGSHPSIPPIKGLDVVPYFTPDTLFAKKELPKSIMILGGGPVGVEIACALSALGIKTTLIEMNKRLLSKEDPELTAILENEMVNSGVTLKLGTKARAVSYYDSTIKVDCTETDKSKVSCTAEAFLVAIGRKPNIEGLRLQDIGVQTDKHGIKTNNKLQTTVSNIYACGDVVGPYLFSHMAEYQAVVATRNACIPVFKKTLNYRDIIWVTFSHPEFARAGLTEAEAREGYKGKIRVYRMHFDQIDRGRVDNVRVGMAKIICDQRNRILGAHILGPCAGEIIHEVQVGKYYNLPLTKLYNPIHAYPTYSELIWHIAKKAYILSIEKNWFINIIRTLWRTPMKKDKKPIIIHVLDKDVFDDCRIEGSINMPYKDIKERAKELNKDDEIIVYCANYTCPASKNAYKMLKDLGFANVKAYEGGIQEWLQKGFPVEGACQMEFLKKELVRPEPHEDEIEEITAEELYKKHQGR